MDTPAQRLLHHLTGQIYPHSMRQISICAVARTSFSQKIVSSAACVTLLRTDRRLSMGGDRLPGFGAVDPVLFDEAPDGSLYLGSHAKPLLPAFFISVSHLNEVMTEPALH